MSTQLSIQEKYDIGYPVFKALFDMNKEELISKLTEVCGVDSVAYKNILEYADKGLSVKKTIVNDKASEIIVDFYDRLQINAFGIHFVGEHGYGNCKIVEFNKFFVLA